MVLNVSRKLCKNLSMKNSSLNIYKHGLTFSSSLALSKASKPALKVALLSGVASTVMAESSAGMEEKSCYTNAV